MIENKFFKKKSNAFLKNITIKIFKEIFHRQTMYNTYMILFLDCLCHTVSYGRPMLRENTKQASLLPSSGCFTSKHLRL